MIGRCNSAGLATLAGFLCLAGAQAAAPIHIYDKVELTFNATGRYANPYTDAEVWVDLKGPNFAKRCYGFWDGGQVFRVRITSSAQGKWTWVSGSHPFDSGISNKTGSFVSADRKSTRLNSSHL